MSVTIRAMTDADVAPASEAQIAAFTDLELRQGGVPSPPTGTALESVYERHRHFLTHDPAGSWVAVDDGQVIGCALALRRDSLWGLSLLVVDPRSQSSGAGRRLLEATFGYSAGCERSVILSSTDPRAMRAYATSGFDLHAQVEGKGEPDRAALPALDGRVRFQTTVEPAWADTIDRAVRGAARGDDHLRLAGGQAVFVVDDVDGKGYAYLRFREQAEVAALAATDDATATALLWRCLAHAAELGQPALVSDLNAGQQWAIRVAYAARLKVTPAGPVFWRGGEPPASYLPSGAYL
jgi:GNAT superfamily N-acetyltransferase